MRSLYLPEFKLSDELEVQGDDFHHLVNVVRSKIDENILLISGNGHGAIYKIAEINKKNVLLKFVNTITREKEFSFDVALCGTKKDALDLNLKQAIELGASRISILKSDYSNTVDFKESRVLALVKSSVEQSNALFIPEINFLDLRQINFDSFDSVLLFCNQTQEIAIKSQFTKDTKVLIIIGPEGGFSNNEIEFFKNNSKISIIHFPTNILRATTALPCAFGYTLKNLKFV